MKKLLISLVFIFGIVSSCLAANWYYIGYDTQNSQYYIDNSSVQKNSYYAIVWVKVINTNGSHSLGRVAFNHGNHMYSLQSYINYDANGNIINSANFQFYDWNAIPPESMAEDIFYNIWRY